MSGTKVRRGLPVLGTLGELFPTLRADPEELPYRPVHGRVLVAGGADGERRLVVVCWEDPGGAERLHAEVRDRVESVMLAELGRTPGTDTPQMPSALDLIFFAEVPGAADALRAFGLERRVGSERDTRDLLAHIRGEASTMGRTVPDSPTSIWTVPFALPPPPRDEVVMALDAAIQTRLGSEVWGERPGAFYAALNDALRSLDRAPLPSTGDGIDALEAIAGHFSPGVIRWIPPFVFQALCDMVGVVAARQYGRKVEWAPTEAESPDAPPSPPLIRVQTEQGYVHVPLGLHLLRWSVMPVAPFEVVPAIAEWVLDQFGRDR